MSAVVPLRQEIDLFETYFEYVKDTEPPYIFHRWCLITALGALLGRQFYLPFGEKTIFPNLFTMLVGEPGTRKSTAIFLSKKVLSAAGYTTIAATKTSKEKFLLDLEGEGDDSGFGRDPYSVGASKKSQIMQDIFGSDGPGEHKEVLVAADEFNEFVGSGNHEFLSTLGTFWDWHDDKMPFTQRFKTSKSVSIWNPTVSILAGNTYTGIANCFSGDAAGQGFLSRLLFIHGERSSRRIHRPKAAPEEIKLRLASGFENIKRTVSGPANISPGADRALEVIYKTWNELEDARFKHYSTRRYSHLLKLLLIVAAARCSKNIEEQDVVMANTLLTFAEHRMPRALGEWGKSKNSEVSNTIMSVLADAKEPMTFHKLWLKVSTDLERPDDLIKILAGLNTAEKIQEVESRVTGNRGYLPMKKVLKYNQNYCDFNLLADKEGTER